MSLNTEASAFDRGDSGKNDADALRDIFLLGEGVLPGEEAAVVVPIVVTASFEGVNGCCCCCCCGCCGCDCCGCGLGCSVEVESPMLLLLLPCGFLRAFIRATFSSMVLLSFRISSSHSWWAFSTFLSSSVAHESSACFLLSSSSGRDPAKGLSGPVEGLPAGLVSVG